MLYSELRLNSTCPDVRGQLEGRARGTDLQGSSRAVLMKAKAGGCILLRLYHKLGGLQHKKVLTHSSRTCKAESKVVFPVGREGGSVHTSL